MPRPLSITSAVADAVSTDLLTPPSPSSLRRSASDAGPNWTAPVASTSAVPDNAPQQWQLTDAQLELVSDSEDSESSSLDIEIEPEDGTPHKRPSSLRSIGSGKSSFAIRIVENDQLYSFVDHCTIGSFFAVQPGKPGGYVVYELELVTNQGTTIRTLKRYSHFVQLRQALYAQQPKSRYREVIVPKLPRKHLVRKFHPELLERRRQTLAFWLQCILRHPDLGNSDIVKQWLLE